MAHAFDTALTTPQRTRIRDGVVTALARLLKVNGGYLNAIVPYGGVVRGFTDEVGIEQLWTVLQGRAPAVAIAMGDKVYGPAGAAFNFQASLELVVYVLSRNPRNLVARLATDVAGLADDTNNPGIDVILEHVEQLLIGFDVAKGIAGKETIKQLRPVREEELATLNSLTLWVQTFNVPVTRTINPNRDITLIIDGIDTRLVTPSGTDTDEVDDWVTLTLYAIDDEVIHFDGVDTYNRYQATAPGTSGATGPVLQVADETDGTVHWKWIGERASNWILSESTELSP